MAFHKLGSHGLQVERIQKRLRALDFYRGPVDGAFGGDTEAAVRAFQKDRHLDSDGVVGAATWEALFNKAIPATGPPGKPLDLRCLGLTGAFETGQGPPECFAGLSGDFDGQGMSLGVLQWNFGQDSLQPMLQQMLSRHARVAKAVFQSNYGVLKAALASDKTELMRFARSIQDPLRHSVNEPWRGMFKALCRTAEFQAIQVQHAGGLFRAAQDLAAEYGLWSQRAVALMFDIKVQNGSIGKSVRAQIMTDFDRLPAGLAKEDVEVERMAIIANRRAEAASPRWIEDVRARKLCIARGAGVVHGIRYDLEQQFGISLQQQPAR